MGDNINTGSKGVFPSNGEKTEGTINPIKVTTSPVTATATVIPAAAKTIAPTTTQKQYNLEHHDEIGGTILNSVGETYARIETKNEEGEISGIMELDLISFREKGQENRYLSIETTGVGEDGNQIRVSLALDNESDFNMFKKFISNLNWND